MLWNIHTNYSLRYGTFTIDNLVQKASELGFQTLGITDINNSTGMFEFIKACEQYGIKPVVGIEFREGNHLLFTAVAKSTSGIEEINRLLSAYNLNGVPYGEQLKHLKHTFIVYPLSNYPGLLMDHELIGIRISELNRLIRKDVTKIKHKLILQQPVTFLHRDHYLVHLHLRAIDNNVLLSRLMRNAIAEQDEYLMQEADIIHACRYYPFILNNTQAFLGRCSISFEFKTNKNKKVFTSSRYEDKELLKKLSLEGLEYRYGSDNTEALRRVQKELEIIDQLNFSAYFLITWDIIRYTMSKGYYHVGRGSGANSIVAYCLRITDVDPIELDLYFERFLNPKRSSPPDFDIDYSWKERPLVHDYIFKRYGKEHTALLGTINTFQSSSIYRELGKVYGLPKSEIDLLVEQPHKADLNSPIYKSIVEVAHQIKEFPNHRSIHAGGVLISDESIYKYSALDLPPVGLPVVQWDMHLADEIGFEKFDILSQRGIGHIKEAADLVFENRKIKVDVHDVKKFKNDPLIRKQLKSANSIGCFYIESPGMRGLLQKLKCDNYIHLVAASSIIRPGVAQSGMMKAYIKRFHNPESVEYLHPVMKEQLEETFGVMVYQEDVIKVCHHFAGLDMADADVLRRAMSGKTRRKKEMQLVVNKFHQNCIERGYPDELIKEVWRQIDSFAGYSFSKAHSASFAVESFQSLFLKTYYPKEFMVAVINNFGGFYKTWVYVTELVKTGANLHLPCVNESGHTTNIKGNDVYLGFIHIESLEHKTVEMILDERELNGPFLSFTDFAERVPVSTPQLKILIKAGAMRFSGMGKKNLMWQAYMRQQKSESVKEVVVENRRQHEPKPMQALVPETVQSILFARPHETFTLPELVHNKIEDAYDEIELLGFSVSMSEFDLLQTDYRGDVKATELSRYLHQTVRMVGSLVTVKKLRTSKGQPMCYGTFYDCERSFFDTTNFSRSLEKYPFQGNGVYLIEGKVIEEFGFYTVEVSKMAKLPTRPDPRY